VYAKRRERPADDRFEGDLKQNKVKKVKRLKVDILAHPPV